MERAQRFGPSAGLQALILMLVLLALIVAATGMGYIGISPTDVLKVVFGKLFHQLPWLSEVQETHARVILDVRLPRILSSACVGAGLALAGVIFQGLLLNPLADPFTLGVSSGAAFGASIALLFHLEGLFSVSMAAFMGGLGTLVAVIALSNIAGRIHTHNLILSGVIVASILSAGISFMKYLADEQVSVIIYWLMGSFTARTWPDVWITLIFVLIGLAVGMFFSRDLNIMSLGQRSAESLGVETQRVRLALLVTASLVTAVCVSVSGIIGFIGLVIPHLMRFFVGPDNRALLPVSMLAGAILLLLADTFTRVLLPGEMPIGVLTALIGGPVFCYILRVRQLRRTHV